MTLIQENEAKKIFAKLDDTVSRSMVGFGGAVVHSLGSCTGNVQIQSVQAKVEFVVVPDQFLKYQILIGQIFTEQPHVQIVKTTSDLIFKTNYDVEGIVHKFLKLRVMNDVTVRGVDLVEVLVESKFNGDIYVRSSYRGQPGKEYQIEEGIYTLLRGRRNFDNNNEFKTSHVKKK